MEAVKTFATKNSITWSMGYGLTNQTIRGLRVVNQMQTPGYEVMPTLLLVSSGGTVLWTDEAARMKHIPENEMKVISGLRQVLDTHLQAATEPVE